MTQAGHLFAITTTPGVSQKVMFTGWGSVEQHVGHVETLHVLCSWDAELYNVIQRLAQKQRGEVVELSTS